MTEIDTTDMSRGPERAASTHELLKILRSGEKPGYPAADIAERFDVTNQTARNWLSDLAETNAEVESETYPNQTLYYSKLTYSPASNPADEALEDRHIRSLVDWATDSFVGLRSAPWTAIHPNDGPATEGDIIQLQVEGTPEDGWDSDRVRPARLWEDRRHKIRWEETTVDKTQALVSGVLYERPAVPIAHIDIPDDYDLEEKVGIKSLTNEDGNETGAFVAYGSKNHLIRPCDNAVFLSDPSVDWICPEGYGAGEMPEAGLEENLREEVEQWREEQSNAAEDEERTGGEL